MIAYFKFEQVFHKVQNLEIFQVSLHILINLGAILCTIRTKLGGLGESFWFGLYIKSVQD